MPNLPLHKFPELLKQLYYFDQKVTDFYLDIEFIREDDDNLRMLVPEYVDQFEAFAIDGTGSVMAFWLYNDEITIDQAPIVYLDSEGGGGIAASSSRQFLSLLPYDTYIAVTISNHWIQYQLNPKRIIPPKETYTLDFFEELVEDLTNSNPCYQDFRKWLSDEMKIEPIRNPLEEIVKNLETYPTFPINLNGI